MSMLLRARRTRRRPKETAPIARRARRPRKNGHLQSADRRVRSPAGHRTQPSQDRKSAARHGLCNSTVSRGGKESLSPPTEKALTQERRLMTQIITMVTLLAVAGYSIWRYRAALLNCNSLHVAFLHETVAI